MLRSQVCFQLLNRACQNLSAINTSLTVVHGVHGGDNNVTFIVKSAHLRCLEGNFFFFARIMSLPSLVGLAVRLPGKFCSKNFFTVKSLSWAAVLSWFTVSIDTLYPSSAGLLIPSSGGKLLPHPENEAITGQWLCFIYFTFDFGVLVFF
jgi:hypothetical protein